MAFAGAGVEPSTPDSRIDPPGYTPEMTSYLLHSEKEPLSEDQMRQLLGHDIPIVEYKRLSIARNYDSIADSKGRLVVFFRTSPTFGHWIGLWKDPETRTLNVYDSYGSKPGDPDAKPLSWLTSVERYKYANNRKQFALLAARSGLRLGVNRVCDQGRTSQACGRFVAVRLWFKHLSDAQFNEFLRSEEGLRPDEFVTLLTDEALQRYA